MDTSRPSPSRPKLGTSSKELERSLVINENKKKLKSSTLWGTVNACLLGIVLYEIIYTCPIKRVSFILYFEYILALLFSFNILYYIICYIAISAKSEVSSQAMTTPVQQSPVPISLFGTYQSTPTNTLSNTVSTPMNTTAHSWISNTSGFNSSNMSYSPTSYSYVGNIPQFVHHISTSSPANVSFQDVSKTDSMSEEGSLAAYLKGYEVYDRSTSINDSIGPQTSVGNSFWTHPAATTIDTASSLRNCKYQLSPISAASSSSSPSSQSDETASPSKIGTFGMEIWRRFNIDCITLTQWNANIRTWLSQTIVERLVKEIENIDDMLQKHGLSEIRVGAVGIDRLRKTAEVTTILQTIPTLSILVPFLEVCTNQEYFIKRLRELARVGCMSDFKWNGGSSFNGREWNDSLPTDSDIIMHLFVTYMDTQLLPNPSDPDSKPFTGTHYFNFNAKVPTPTASTLAIHQFVEKPPQYRVLVGEEVYEVMKGYNNLFHSILLFLYHVHKKEHGMLGRINLGRAGVNILWVINS